MSPTMEFASGPRFDVAARLRAADEWFRSKGLPTLAERRAARGGLATARRVPSRATPAARSTARTGPTVFIVAAPGGGRDQRGAAEAFGSAAWRQDELDARPFQLLVDGHGSVSIATSGPDLRADVDPLAGLVVTWRPDMNDMFHRRAVADIESGLDGVSIEFKRGASLTLPSVSGERRTLIVHAALEAVALVRGSGQSPLYAGALAAVSHARSQEHLLRDRRRAIDKALMRARAAGHGV